MRVWAGLLALALSTVSILPWGAAVHPLDDDAGSGGDAPDAFPAALPVTDGTFRGRLTSPVDQWDTYALSAEPGMLVDIRIEGAAASLDVSQAPAGDGAGLPTAMGIVPAGFQRTFLVAAPGVLYLRVAAGPISLIPTEKEYQVTVASAAAAAWDADARTSGWIVSELHAAEPTQVLYSLTATANTASSEPWAALFHRESNSPGAPPYFYVYWAQTGTARTVHVGPAGLGPAALPDVGVFVDGDTITVSADFPAFQGDLRVSVFHTGATSPIGLTIGSRGTAALAVAGGDDLVAWGSDDHPDAADVVTPVASAQGPLSTQWAVEGRFLGVAEAWFRELVIDGPAGTWSLPDPVEETTFALLRDLPTGTWQAHASDRPGPAGLAGPVGVGPAAAAVHVAGFNVPALGVAPLRLAGHEAFAPVCAGPC